MRLQLPCVVPDCGRARATEDPLLPLCGRHLPALESHCKEKHRLAGVRLARRELTRLAAAGLDHRSDGVEPRSYRCELCASWHNGHDIAGSTGEQDAKAAAAALRTTLTADQYADLLRSWRPSRTPRRTRGTNRP